MARKPTPESELKAADGVADAALAGAPLADPAQTAPTKGPDGFVVIVTGPAAGRWRAGRKFSKERVVIPAEDLTGPEFEALNGDPQLNVRVEPAPS